MKHTHLLSAALVAVFGLSACNDNGATDKAAADNNSTAATSEAAPPETAATPPMDSAAQAKAWMDYMTPGAQHKLLADASGKWKTETTSWMAPDAPPQTSTGEATNEMIMGGRYQRTRHKGMMMGEQFEGKGITAYDNSKKVFVSTWIDNMGTGVMTMEGPWDEASKSMTLKGKMQDPSTGQALDMREVYKIVDDKTHMMEMYCTKDGKEMKMMEMKMTKM